MLKQLKITNIISRLITSWFTISAINLFINNKFNNIEYIQNSNILIYITIFLTVFISYTLLNKTIKKLDSDSLFMLISYTLCSTFWLNTQENFIFSLAIIIIFSLIFFYFIKKNETIFKKIKFNKKIYIITLSLIILIPTIILLAISCLRYYNFNAPNFDFGIFSHIFYNMKNSLLPLSTCERDMLLSHFAVHFSPILYLILPIYFIFSHPITLQIIQVLLLFSGIIPIIKLCNQYSLSKNKTLIISILYCFYPAISCGTFFDFHENCFLPSCLLWLFYFFESNKKIPMYIMTILTLLIKEEAAIYVTIFSLYIIISRKKYIKGIIIFILAISYFLIVSYFMNKYGLGIMTYRYKNFIYNDTGLLNAIKTIFLNPGYTLTQALTVEKLYYLLKLILPLAFLPFLTKKFSRLILVVPILINILSNYTYQYDITFHYSFGIIAFLFYASIQNIADIKTNTTLLLGLALITCLCIYYNHLIPRLDYYINDWATNKKNNQKIENILNDIPKNSSISASTFFVPHLANRKEIYEVYYHENKTDIEYIVLDMRYEDNHETIEYYLNNNYKIITEEKNLIIILKKTD